MTRKRIVPSDKIYGVSPPPRLRTPAARRDILDFYIENFDARATDLASQLHSGALTPSMWEQAMRQEIKDLHTGAVCISRGGDWRTVTQSDWGRLGGHIRKQYQYLHRYAQQVQQKALEAEQPGGKFYSEKYLQWRSKLYGGNARASFYRGMALNLLPQIPGDGTTQCGPSCRCELQFEEGDEPGLILVYWIMHPEAEHCPDCENLAATWNPYELWLPIGISAREWAIYLPKLEVHIVA